MTRYQTRRGIALLISWALVLMSAQWVQASEIVARGVDNPSVSDFVRRVFPALAVLGDYLYIDGGEVAQYVNGNAPDRQRPSYSSNTTLSLSLKESWTNSTVALRSISKKAPLLNSQSLWTDPTTNSFYTWAGMSSWFGTPPANELWQFKADGSGGGEWAQVQPKNVVVFSQLVRPNAPAAADSTGIGKQRIGYALGGEGIAFSDTSITRGVSLALPGLVSYNMETGEWKNTSSAPFGDYGTLLSGAAEYVPFGSDGLLLFMGGASSTVGNTTEGMKRMDFNNLTLYDPSTDKWYSQPTTGSRPLPLDRPCTVGAKGPNGTYEIFIYGGMSMTTLSTSDEVYVLSLPGFVFFKAPNRGTPRNDLACIAIGKGKRQMLAVGGSNGWLGFPQSILDKDPWAQGLGILDMTELKWTDSYDPNAADYQTPSLINDWYQQGGLQTVRWNNDAVKGLFVTQNGTSNTNTNSTGSGSSSSGSGSSAGSGSSSGSNSNNSTETTPTTSTGAIAGGVVGGVAGIALVGALIWFILRRRRRRQSPRPSEAELDPSAAYNVGAGGYRQGPGGEYYAPPSSTAEKTELQDYSPYGQQQQLYNTHYPPVELPAEQGRHELNGLSGTVELPDAHHGGLSVRR